MNLGQPWLRGIKVLFKTFETFIQTADPRFRSKIETDPQFLIYFEGVLFICLNIITFYSSLFCRLDTCSTLFEFLLFLCKTLHLHDAIIAESIKGQKQTKFKQADEVEKN